MKVLLLLFLTVIAVNCYDYKWLETVGNDFSEYLHSGEINPNLRHVLNLLTPSSPITRATEFKSLDIPLFQHIKAEDRSVVTCAICRTFIDSAFTWYEEGLTEEEFLNRLTNLCVDLGLYTERVCRGTIASNLDLAIWIATTKNETSNPLLPAHVCGFAIYGDCALDEQLFDWTLDLDFLGPKPTPETPQLPPEGSPTIKVIQFTDVHIDPNYRPGFNAECGEPTCCRLDQGIPENATAAAGYWGDPRDCDLPLHAFQDMLQEAAVRHQDVAYVIFTGDVIDHGVWSTSLEYNIDLLTTVQNEFNVHFPNVPVLSIFGNHEPHPLNVFSDPRKTEIPENLTTTWLYQLGADIWNLPAETRPDILAGGMYTIEVMPGLVVIGINTMFCYNYNWWLMYDNVDPAGELMWLANKLLEFEQQGKKVHILGHHPSGNKDCMHFWSKNYRRIIDRFENTVVAQFHGHTHNDHFYVYYDLQDQSRATSVAFDAGSGTAFSDINPNYRTYTIDPASYRVLDHETWSFNLTEANILGPNFPPNWGRSYGFREAYNVNSLFPAEMDQLVTRMSQDQSLQELYFRHYVKQGDISLAEGCDTECLQNLVCKITVTVSNDESKCAILFP